MRFRQWINDPSSERRPDHNYARSWLEDPTLSTALPHVELFNDPFSIDCQKITWPPTITHQIPEDYQCEEQTLHFNDKDEERLMEIVKELIDQVHLAALCGERVRDREEQLKRQMNE